MLKNGSWDDPIKTIVPLVDERLNYVQEMNVENRCPSRCLSHILAAFSHSFGSVCGRGLFNFFIGVVRMDVLLHITKPTGLVRSSNHYPPQWTPIGHGRHPSLSSRSSHPGGGSPLLGSNGRVRRLLLGLDWESEHEVRRRANR